MSENMSKRVQTRRPDGTHRVVITGVGAVTPAGVGVDALWSTLMERGCCIGPIERFDTTDYEVHTGSEVRDFDGVEHGLSKKEARRFERFVQYAIVAADEALAQSGLTVTDENRDRIAVVFGTGIGGIDELQKSFATLEEKGPKRVNPLFIPTMIGNIAAGNLAIRYGMRGECLNVVTACATGAHCIGTALRDIRHGYIDAALVGGTEESVSPICIAGFTNLSALTRAEDPKQASLPFDARRCEPCRYSFSDAYDTTKRLLGRCPELTALFCVSDVMALGAIRAIHDLGRRVPRDISVVGYDGIPLSRFSVPRLTTVRQDTQQLARQGVDLLLRNLQRPRPPVHGVVPFELIAGESVSPPRGATH